MLRQLLKKVFSNELLIEPAEFIIKVAMVYALWRGLKYCGETYPGFLWGGWAAFYDFIGNLLAYCNSVILNVMGIQHIHEKRVIIVAGTNGIEFSDLCLGIAPMFIYSGIILAFGTNLKAKLWFIPMGVFLIFLINVFRLLALILIQARYNSYFDFAHDYLYVVVTYSLIFVLVMWWMNRWAFAGEENAG
ncbi:MAG: archaeosortase/exosortase family protein [Bacteroidetes bacterium]|nr:archaeosortase/exosortase family protein [Bacteroidota bacterium]